MRIILKYIITNLSERKTRTIVMLLSIVLSTVLLFVSFSIGTSYENAQRKMARGRAGTAVIAITKGNGEAITPEEIPDLPDIRSKVGFIERTVMYHENGYYETVDLLATDLEELNKINPPRLISGEEISGFTGNQVILPDRFTSKYNIQKGEQIHLQINGESIPFQVADIAAYDTVFLRHTRGATVLLPRQTMSALFGVQGYDELLIEPEDGITTEMLLNELVTNLPGEQYHVSNIVNEASIIADARQKSMPFFLISFFALTMSVFIIYSSYKVITLDRLPVIGTFRSIGATSKRMTQILLLESIIYGCLGGLLGIGFGIIALKIILQGMGKQLSEGGIEIPITISPIGTLGSFAVAVIVSMLSAWIPIRKASRLPIKDVVLGTVEEKKISNKWIALIGISLLVISFVLPKVANENTLFLAGGFSLLGMIVATILLIPIITNGIARILEPVFGVIFQNEGMLATKNLRDNKNISQNVTLLFISISAIIAITVVGNFVNTYIVDVFRGAEIQGFADGTMNQEFVDEVKGMDGVQKVLANYVYDNDMQTDGNVFGRLEATDRLDWYDSMLNLHYENEEQKVQAEKAFTEKRVIILSKDCMARLGVQEGDVITLSNALGTNEYQVMVGYKSRATDVEALISTKYAREDFGAEVYDFLAYTAVDPDAVMIQIRNLFGDTENWSRTVEEFNTDALTTVGAFLQPIHSMTYFILLLATVGIVNNLLINFMQKKRTIAMYKSVGLSNRQNRKMTLIEGFTSGLIGAGIAMGISYLEIQTIFFVAGPKISMVPELTPVTFFAAGGMGIVITLIGSIVPMIKGNHMHLVNEIKFE